jgi:hypothetical protein
VATGGGDVVRRRLREKRSEGREGIPCGRVWRRWWKLFHEHIVGRGFVVRSVTAVCDRDVANRSRSGSCNDGRLCVRTGVAKQGVMWNSSGGKHGLCREVVVHRQLVARGFERRSATTLGGKEFGSRSCSVGRLPV